MRAGALRPGLMLMVTILIVGLVGLIIGLSVALRGTSEVSRGAAAVTHQKLVALAHVCAQEAIYRMVSNNGYQGETIAIGPDSCTGTRTTMGGNVYAFHIDALSRTWHQRLFLKIDVGTTPITVLEYYLVP